MKRFLNGLAALSFLAGVILRNPLLFLLAVILALVSGISSLWEHYALAGVSYARRLGIDRLFVGEETSLEIELVNAKPLPLAWLRLEDEMPGEIQLRKGRLHYSHKPTRRVLMNIFSLRFYERVRKTYQIRAMQRGVLRFGPAGLHVGDLFGFQDQTVELAHLDRLIVYPRLVPVTALGLPAGHPAGDQKVLRWLIDDPLRVSGVRPYVAGDQPRFLHWKATARRGALQTKVFEPGALRTTAIFLDQRTVLGTPGIISAYLELAILAAASVSHYLLEQREAVGLYTNSWLPQRPRGQVRLPASRRPDQETLILETLAWLDGMHFGTIDAYLLAERPALPWGAAVVVISATVTDNLKAALWDVRRAGHLVCLLAIGEQAPEGVPPDVRTYWLGGREAYERLSKLDLSA